MKDCLILGCGRSGTSMLAGILHQAGYFMGEAFHPPRDSNPKGFFEWPAINRINESLLAPLGRSPLRHRLIKAVLKKNTVENPGPSQRWLMVPPAGADVGPVPSRTEAAIRSVLGKAPYAFKDPRFSFTLPAWRPFLEPDAVFLCVFRDPAATVASILKECRGQDYLANLYITRRDAYRVWTAVYRSVLDHLDPAFGRFLYVHYDQIADGSALPRLEEALQAGLTQDSVDPQLRRSRSRGRAPRAARELYARICRLAGYNPFPVES